MQLRADLMDHLTALLSQPMEEIALNGPLVAQAQNILSEMPLAQRVYNGILNSQQATGAAEMADHRCWRPIGQAGAGAQLRQAAERRDRGHLHL